MKVLVLYRPESDHGRTVDEFVNNFHDSSVGGRLEVVNIDTREGISTATLYDVTRYPAVLVVRDDGALQHSWQGVDLPLVNEVEGYFNS
jgi:hypothetical protein